MSVTLAYTSTTGDFSRAHQMGWDAVDSMVERAALNAVSADLADVRRLLPSGLRSRTVYLTLRSLVADGRLNKVVVARTGQPTTTVYTAASAADIRKAA